MQPPRGGIEMLLCSRSSRQTADRTVTRFHHLTSNLPMMQSTRCQSVKTEFIQT